MKKAAALFQAPAAFPGLAAPAAAGGGDGGDHDTSRFETKGFPTSNPRYLRVLFALLRCIEGIPREQLDRIAGTSNSPEVVRRLKQQYGVGIVTERIPCRDRDGRASVFGLYSLGPEARRKVADWFAVGGACLGEA
jgi:hypothetical protein